MKRALEKDLLEWKQNPRRLPLLLRGARQVGKSYVLEKFGNEHFGNVVTVNFEYQPHIQQCFADLNPNVVVSKLEAILNVKILAGKTLLILDEIQACPQAILALRYFKEKLPDLHVIGAVHSSSLPWKRSSFHFQ